MKQHRVMIPPINRGQPRLSIEIFQFSKTGRKRLLIKIDHSTTRLLRYVILNEQSPEQSQQQPK